MREQATDQHRLASEKVGRVLERKALKEAVESVRGGERVGIFVREHPEKFARMLSEFDAVIKRFNRTNHLDQNVFLCSSNLKMNLGDRPLPPLIPDKPSLGQIRSLYHTVRDVADSMSEGQGSNPSDYSYRFHLQKPSLSDEALVVGTLFHAYEVGIGVTNPRLIVDLKRETKLVKNYILDPLVEMAVGCLPSSLIFREVVGSKNTGHLDWVYGYPGFSDELQRRFVGKENWTR